MQIIRRKSPSTPAKQKGLTLVELLVAIALQGLILITLSQVYVVNKQLSVYQAELTNLQEVGGYVTAQLNVDIHSAGFSGCRSLDDLAPTIIANNFTGFSSNTGAATLFDDGAGWTPPAGFTRLAGTDVLRIQYAGAGAYLTGNLATENANIQVNRNPDNLEAGDLVLITDCSESDIFRATAVSSGAGNITIAHANNNNTTNKLSKKYGRNSQIFAFHEVEYFLATFGGVTGLYQVVSNGTPVLISDQVTDMQFNLTTDTGGVGTGINYQLLLATRDNLTTSPQSITFNGANLNTGTGADRRLRRAFLGFANLRNNTP